MIKAKKYYIFKIINNKKRIVKSFLANTDKLAFNIFKKYVNKHKDNKIIYYYCTKEEFNSKIIKKSSFIKNIFSFIKNIFDKIKVFFKYNKMFLFHESSNDYFIYILEQYIKDLYNIAVPYKFLFKARKHLDNKNNLKQSFLYCPIFSDEEVTYAKVLWHKNLDNVLLNIKLYKYYSLSNALSKKDYNEIENKLGYEIPTINCQYNKIDYNELNKLSNLYWKRIWSWISEYGVEIYASR